jgi:hypothetical protein
MVNDVLFNQRGTSLGMTEINVLLLLSLMLQVSRDLGNRRIRRL